MSRELTLQQADETTRPYVETLLDESGLPSGDVRAKLDCLYIGYNGDTRVGVGGLEKHGSAGLLRSVVVEESARGNGVGTQLCVRLERKARRDGIETLYLLTTTASEFFADIGYRTTERSDAPAAIQQTTEFDDFCPATATCMTKSL